MALPYNSDVQFYNHVSFYTWTFRGGAQGSLLFWVNPDLFLSSSYRGSKTKSQLRSYIKEQYQNKGVKVLAQVFGSFEHPTTAGYIANEVAINLAQFVINYDLDGVDIDYQDSLAFYYQQGESWMIDFTKKLKSLLPNHLIVHTVNAAYFVGQHIYAN